MTSTQREKLIELLKQDPELFFDRMGESDYENLADYLLANDVVVLPCRCIKCIYFDRGRWMCKRQVCMKTHFYGFCDFGELKDGEK